MNPKSISQFIHNERAHIKMLIQKGVYSNEFALGQLAGLINLAAAGNLNGIIEDIKIDIYNLVNDQLFGSNQVGNGDSEKNAIIHYESSYMTQLRDAWSPDGNTAGDKTH
ncbi:hypothetical protein BK120_22880 [Paenibacillus sp. FSL A5-0031]|nr:hypothetical protein BK120_22880 [Paenibacillus sp. FSL A5-0031]